MKTFKRQTLRVAKARVLVLAPQMSMSSFVALELIATVSMGKRVGVLLMARQRLHVLLTIGNAK